MLDVLVVGAGPTGLTLACQLQAFGARFRIVDRQLDRAHESRALAVQPRTLEVLARIGVTEPMVREGNRAARMMAHFGEREFSARLFDIGADDTAYPFLLFLSQAKTERILDEHLASGGATVERGVELAELTSDVDGVAGALRHGDGRREEVQARYVVGCDGARSTVRRLAGIPFTGHSYPQTFVLADLEADGVDPSYVHAFVSGDGFFFLFPLGEPTTWRLQAMRHASDPTPPDAPVHLEEVQAICDAYTDGRVRLRDPVWMTNFRLHNRGAQHYRAGRMFLAGDAAHIHSPAGAQGMNTGIQDSINLGWKLAYVAGGAAAALLDTYEPERAPIGHRVLRITDRLYAASTSTHPVVRLLRTRVIPLLAPLGMRLRRVRAYGFRMVSELALHYRGSALSVNGPGTPRRGPRAGDRLPDAPLVHDGHATTLHATVGGAGFHLLLCGPAPAWPDDVLKGLRQGHRWLVTVERLGRDPSAAGLVDPDGTALRRLGLPAHGRRVGQILVRPDGYLGYRAGGTDLRGLIGYLARILGEQG